MPLAKGCPHLSFKSIWISVPAGTCGNTCCCARRNATVKICTLMSDAAVRPGMWIWTIPPSAGLGYKEIGVWSEVLGVDDSEAVSEGDDVGVVVVDTVGEAEGVAVSEGNGVAVAVVESVGTAVCVRVAVGNGVKLRVGVALGVALGTTVVVDVGV